MVYSHRAIGYLVTAITVDISNTQVVVALSGIACPLWGIGIKYPVLFQFFAIPVPCSNNRTGVVATTKDGTGTFTVQIANACQHAIAAIGIVVAPLFHFASLRNIGFCIHHLARQSVEHADIVRSCQNASHTRGTFFIILAPLAFRFGTLCRCLRIGAVVSLCITYHMTFAVACTISGTDNKLRTSITIQVVDDEWHIMCTTADIDAHVYTPQQRTIQTVAVEECLSCESVMRIVVGIGRVPFQDNLILSVAIDITY